MKLKIFFFIIFSLLLSSTSYASLIRNERIPAIVKTTNEQKLIDGEIIAWLIIVDKNEIAAAHQVLRKSHNPMVREYANMMVRDHSKNLQQTAFISRKMQIRPISTKKVDELLEAGKNELTSLINQKDRRVLDQDYIQAMVKGHTGALATIDQDLHRAYGILLINHLKATRATVLHHLLAAKAIENHAMMNSN